MTELLDELRLQNPQFETALMKPILSYLLTARNATGGDLERNIILLVIGIRAVEHPEFRMLMDAGRRDDLSVFPSLGTNTSSISESTGIPHETVRRKVADLVRSGWIARVGRRLHFTLKAWEDLAAIREAREQLGVQCYEIVRKEALKLPFAHPD
jgi:hypothetical protein